MASQLYRAKLVRKQRNIIGEESAAAFVEIFLLRGSFAESAPRDKTILKIYSKNIKVLNFHIKFLMVYVK